jgi:hypothetical protein
MILQKIHEKLVKKVKKIWYFKALNWQEQNESQKKFTKFC